MYSKAGFAVSLCGNPSHFSCALFIFLESVTRRENNWQMSARFIMDAVSWPIDLYILRGIVRKCIPVALGS